MVVSSVTSKCSAPGTIFPVSSLSNIFVLSKSIPDVKSDTPTCTLLIVSLITFPSLNSINSPVPHLAAKIDKVTGAISSKVKERDGVISSSTCRLPAWSAALPRIV